MGLGAVSWHGKRSSGETVKREISAAVNGAPAFGKLSIRGFRVVHAAHRPPISPPRGTASRSRRRSQRSCEFSFASTMSCLIALLVTSSAMAADAPSISWMQLFPATSPTPRSYFAMTYDAASEKVIVFGGFDGAGYLNDIWTFDGVNWTKVNTPPCPPCAPMPDGL